jgi:cytochrome c oxidase assembly factor CtaG
VGRAAAVAILASVALLVVGLGTWSPQFCIAALVIAAIASLIASLVQIRRAGCEIAGLVLCIGALLAGIPIAMGASGCLWLFELALLGLLPLFLFAASGPIALIALAVDRRVEHHGDVFWIPLLALVSVTSASLVLGMFAGACLHEPVDCGGYWP